MYLAKSSRLAITSYIYKHERPLKDEIMRLCFDVKNGSYDNSFDTKRYLVAN